MFCHQCGNQLSDRSKFCEKCGTAVMGAAPQDSSGAEVPHTPPVVPDFSENTSNFTGTAPQSLLNENELVLFVGPKKADYYLRQWKNAKQPEKRAGFNWAAFWLAPFWLGYRKMYLFLAGYFGCLLIFDYITYFIGLDNYGYQGMGIAIGVVFGMFANSWYLIHARKKIAKIKSFRYDPWQQNNEIQKTGGKSAAGVWLAILVFCIYFVLQPEFLSSIFGTGTTEQSVASPAISNTSSSTNSTEIQDYLDELAPITDKLGQISDDYNALRDSDSTVDDEIQQLSDMVDKLTDLSDSVMDIEPPSGYEQAHKHLQNSIDDMKNGLLNFIAADEQGDSSKIAEANTFIQHSNDEQDKYYSEIDKKY
jgi:hypothetical protein